MIRRIAELGLNVENFPDALNLLRVLSLATASLNRLVRTQQLLASGTDEFSQAMHVVMDEIERMGVAAFIDGQDSPSTN